MDIELEIAAAAKQCPGADTGRFCIQCGHREGRHVRRDGGNSQACASVSYPYRLNGSYRTQIIECACDGFVAGFRD